MLTSEQYKEEHNTSKVTFNDYSNDEENVNFNSTWKRVKKTSENSCQTESIKCVNKETQSIIQQDVGVIIIIYIYIYCCIIILFNFFNFVLKIYIFIFDVYLFLLLLTLT